MSRAEFESIEGFLEALPDERQLNVKQLEAELVVLQDLLVKAIEARKNHQAELLSAKIKNITVEIAEIQSVEQLDPDAFNRAEAERLNKKQLFH